jgi:hypothetical protein
MGPAAQTGTTRTWTCKHIRAQTDGGRAPNTFISYKCWDALGCVRMAWMSLGWTSQGCRWDGCLDACTLAYAWNMHIVCVTCVHTRPVQHVSRYNLSRCQPASNCTGLHVIGLASLTRYERERAQRVAQNTARMAERMREREGDDM